MRPLLSRPNVGALLSLGRARPAWPQGERGAGAGVRAPSCPGMVRSPAVSRGLPVPDPSRDSGLRPLVSRHPVALGGGRGLSQGVSPISFRDAEAYERMTGAWSRLVGPSFLDWLALLPGLRWLDAGCGNGAFTALVVDRCAPAGVEGVDPEPAQIAHAQRHRQRPGVRFAVGDAGALAYPPGSFDVAVMALVLAFLRDPAQGVAELVRVLRPGGVACAYSWDLPGGGSPLAPLGLAMRQSGVLGPSAPSESVSCEKAMRQLWIDAGLGHVRTCRITVQRRFDSFEQAWETSRLGASTAAVLSRLDPSTLTEVKARFRANLRQDTRGPVSLTAHAIGVRGRTS